MTTNHKFHGISLAKNSTIENAYFERLAADPLSDNGGRIWYNTTQKELKYSTLDTTGGVIIKTIADQETLDLAIASLTAAVEAEATARGTAIAAEVTARTNAISALADALSVEVAARIAGDAAESQSRIEGDATEAAARTAAVAVAAATAADALATETAARQAGDVAQNARQDALQGEINTVETAVGLNTDGTYAVPSNTTYLGTSTSVKDAVTKLDKALTDECAVRVAADANLASAIANETQSRIDGDTALQAQLTAFVQSKFTTLTTNEAAEVAARIAADTAIKAELDLTQASIGLNADGSIAPITNTNYINGISSVFAGAFALDTQLKVVTDGLAAEETARQTADTAFNARLNTEATARQAKDDAQQAEIDRIEAGAGLETNGAYVPPTNSNYLNDSTSLKDADWNLDAALKAVSNRVTAVEDVSIPNLQDQITAEVNRATTAEVAEVTARTAAVNTLSTSLQSEVSRAVAAENAIETALQAEATARASAVNGVGVALQAEVTRAEQAESNLAASIAAEQSRASAAESSLQTKINVLTAAAGDGANALKASLNSGRFTYRSTSPSYTHLVTHNLGTDEYIANVMVQDTDGVFRNDIVPIEEVDPQTSFRVTLSELRNIRVVVLSAKTLS